LIKGSWLSPFQIYPMDTARQAKSKFLSIHIAPHAVPHRARCSVTQTQSIEFATNLTQINAIFPGEQCINIPESVR
jgi:hypothetical protein